MRSVLSVGLFATILWPAAPSPPSEPAPEAYSQELPPATPGVVMSMTPALVDEAIAFGGKTDPTFFDNYENAIGLLQISTPFSRVAKAAYDSKSLYKPFTRANVTAAMLKPVVAVYESGRVVQTSPPMTLDYKHIVAAVRNGDTFKIIQPLTIVPTKETWTNSFGKVTTTHGVRATFPIAVLAVGNEFRSIFTNGRESTSEITAESLANIR